MITDIPELNTVNKKLDESAVLFMAEAKRSIRRNNMHLV